MSWQATAYVKELCECPDGAPLSRGQKLLLFVLADYHNTAYKVAWPSIPRLAHESMISLTQIKRDLSYLEQHDVIARKRPEKYGAGRLTRYSFVALDEGETGTPEKRVQNGPFFSATKKRKKRGQECHEIDTERVLLGLGTGPERVHRAQHNKEEQRTSRTKESRNTEQHAENRESAEPLEKNPIVQKALVAWLLAKDELRACLGDDEWKLVFRPAKLLKVLSDRFLLIALPPNQRIQAAAQRHKEELNLALVRQGFQLAGFTVYPDDWTREEIVRRFPEVADTMLGGKTIE